MLPADAMAATRADAMKVRFQILMKRVWIVQTRVSVL
jgi:hypothetical protein